MKLSEKALWKVNNVKSDKLFIKRLAKWVVKYYGNANVAQRLNVLAIKGKIIGR